MGESNRGGLCPLARAWSVFFRALSCPCAGNVLGMKPSTPPEHNVTGMDFGERGHFRYAGPPLVDAHAHVMRTRPPEDKGGSAEGAAEEDPLAQAATMLEVAEEFGVGVVWTMCPPEDVPVLRERFGPRLRFNGPISKTPEGPPEEAYKVLEQYLENGVDLIKFWAAPRGRERGLFVDAPWRVEAARRARAAGVRVVMVHVSDPDLWFRTTYADAAKYGTKADQYVGLRRMLELFPDMTWVAA